MSSRSAKKAPGRFWRPAGEEWHGITLASQKDQCDHLWRMTLRADTGDRGMGKQRGGGS